MNSLESSSHKRIEYIDALRGFTMILVVLYHVSGYCAGIIGDVPNYHHYLQQIRMPLFFLISGFVLYKIDTVWDVKYIFKFLKKKFVVQILSTFFFFILYTHYMEKDFMVGTRDLYKYGYWFTYILFFYYIFYSIIRFLFRRYEDYVIVVIAALFYIINWPPLFQAIPLSDSIKAILSVPFWYYFCFFLLGTLLKKHFDYVQDMLDKWVLITICVFFYFLLNIYNDVIPSSGAIGLLKGFCQTITGVVIVFSFFRANQSSFTKEKFLGRSLQYIGKRTLDIYLLHYFFIPYNLGQIVCIFRDYPMPAVEFVFSLIIASVIILFCLLISKVIRLSPILAHLLFGVKVK